MRIILLIMALIGTSCSSNYSSHNFRKSAADEKFEEEYNWVDQLNFDKKEETKYQNDKDEFTVLADNTNHVLLKESLYNFSVNLLDDMFLKTNDDLIKINIKCYQSKFDDALKMADDVYRQYKNNTSYWNQLGTCYYLMSDFGKAILFYNKSRDLDPKFVPAVNNLGVVYNKLGKFQKALTAFKKASEMSNFSVTPNFNLAQLYLRFGNVGKALPVFVGLQRKGPKDIEVSSALASAYLLKGEYEAAVSIYDSMDKSALLKSSVGFNYAVALKYLNRATEAKTIFDQSVTNANTVELKAYAAKVEKFIRN